MASKKFLILIVLLAVIAVTLWAGDDIVKDIYLSSTEDIIRWTNGFDVHDKSTLYVSRYKKGKLFWRYKTEDITRFAGNHEVPLSGYALYGDVITFPVTKEDKKSKTLFRRQLALDLKTGVLLWEKNIVCGVSQRYFYSYSDGMKLFIHNLHEHLGSQFICLNLKTGDQLWENKSLVQAAMFLDLGDSFILHSGSLREFYLFSKADGSSRSYLSSSPVVIWGDKPVFIKLNKSKCFVMTLTEKGEEEILFTLPNKEKQGVWSFYRKPYNTFSRKIKKPVVPSLLYKDSLILQMRNGDGTHSLVRYSLKEKGTVIWQRDLNGPIGLENLFSANYPIPHYLNKPLLPAYSKLNPFYRAENPWILVMMKRGGHLAQGYAVVNLDNGKIAETTTPLLEDSAYIHNLCLKSGDYFYLILQRYSASEEGESLILRMRGLEGLFDSYVSFPNNIIDTAWSKPQTAPIYFIMQGKASLLEWTAFGEDIKETLKLDPGLKEGMF